jgi:hypothetical protein
VAIVIGQEPFKMADESGLSAALENVLLSDDNDSFIDDNDDFQLDHDALEAFCDDNIPDDDFGLHWLSEDHLKELFEKSSDSSSKVPPPLKDWKPVVPSKSKFQVTFGKARRILWLQFQEEHKLFRNNVEKMRSATTEDPMTRPLTAVYNTLFGKSSKLAKLFYDKLQLTPECYLCFIMTFFKSCRFRLSVKNLHK